MSTAARPFFRLFTGLTKGDRAYRALVLPAQRIEAALEAAGVLRRRSPAPLAKRRLLAETARRRGIRTFVETGTYLGDTAYELARVVDRVYTIELDADLWARARERFAGAPNVTPLRGDSASVLRGLVPALADPTLFWLDAHYSGHVTARGAELSAARAELGVVLAHWVPGSVILLDDAHCFVGRGGYPSLKTLRALLRARRPELRLRVSRNIIWILGPDRPARRGGARDSS